MKKLGTGVVILCMICFFGCDKALPDDNFACTSLPPSADSAKLLKFAADSSIKATMDSTGLYYQIIDSGSGVKPVLSSVISVTYMARYMWGGGFDSAVNSNFGGAPLSQLLFGWQIGMPKIGVGGHIKLLVPSAYGYGCTGWGPVGPNLPLYFDVQLISVN